MSTEDEIANLQRLRATLEIVRESTEKISKDIETAITNQQSISDEAKRATDLLKKV